MIRILVTVNLLQMAELQHVMHHAKINSLSAIGSDINPCASVVVPNVIHSVTVTIVFTDSCFTVALLQMARLQQLMHHANINSPSSVENDINHISVMIFYYLY